MSGMRCGTVVGRMLRGKCTVCGQDDVAFTKAGKVHPLHEQFSQRHQNAAAMRRDMKAIQDEEREANNETDE